MISAVQVIPFSVLVVLNPRYCCWVLGLLPPFGCHAASKNVEPSYYYSLLGGGNVLKVVGDWDRCNHWRRVTNQQALNGNVMAHKTLRISPQHMMANRSSSRMTS